MTRIRGYSDEDKNLIVDQLEAGITARRAQLYVSLIFQSPPHFVQLTELMRQSQLPEAEVPLCVGLLFCPVHYGYND